VRIDLHTHSRASDGTQSPAELVRAAVDAGLDVLAITDHDTSDGWAEAAATASEVGLTLVRGMELSTWFRGRGVHLLAYLPDPTYPPLVAELGRILGGRDARVPAMVDRLNGLGIPITQDDVRRAAGDAAATGRPHVADALVALGAVTDRDEAFLKYLAAGRPAYVGRYAGDLPEMVGIVADAGGVSVLAHPWGRHERSSLDEAALAELAELGLAGIEVDHQDHDAESRAALRAIARDLGLVATGSSDHHGAGKADHELGVNTTDPEEFARLLALAEDAAQRSGRHTPEVVGA
jgi:predicted metal-dependent phosphoesterase TrpH